LLENGGSLLRYYPGPSLSRSKRTLPGTTGFSLGRGGKRIAEGKAKPLDELLND
jgi:hypothetical protein